MSNKGKKSNKNNSKAKAKVSTSFNYSKIFKRFFVTLSLLAVIAIPFVAYTQKSEIEHDLSVLGNGTPTVVQIHDPSCQLCQRLKNNLGKVMAEFEDKIQFKTANIAKQKGKRFASKYNVPHVTLLFFDKKGKRVNTMQGVSTSEDIKTNLQSLAKLR